MKKINFATASVYEQTHAILDRALSGQGMSQLEMLAMYANENNWKREHGIPNRPACVWTWCGPVIPPFETAQRGIKREQIAPYPETAEEGGENDA